MVALPRLGKSIATAGAVALLLANCSLAEHDRAVSPDTTSSTATEETPEATTTTAAPTTPEPEGIDTSTVGERIALPSADFTVRAIEERDAIPTSFPDSTPPFEPEEGERLWYLDIEWTNNTLEAVQKECHGPDMFDLMVYDLDGAEMLMVDQPGMIEGQECSSGLRQGETGTWYTAFYGGPADFGWAVFTDYGGGEAVVTLDPELELVRDE